jgi:hypothetical protein
MWIPAGVVSGVALLAFLMWRGMRRRSHRIDVGPVSDAWLAEQRARGRESH